MQSHPHLLNHLTSPLEEDWDFTTTKKSSKKKKSPKPTKKKIKKASVPKKALVKDRVCNDALDITGQGTARLICIRRCLIKAKTQYLDAQELTEMLNFGNECNIRNKAPFRPPSGKVRVVERVY